MSLRVWLGFGISLVFLFFAFRGQDYGEIWQALQDAEYRWVLPSLVAYFIGVYLRSARWRYLLRSVSDVPTRSLFPVVVIGYLANNVLPLRAGELVRSYALSVRFGVRKTTALATIAVERLFDGLTMLLFMLIASLSISVTGRLQIVTLSASAIFGVILTVLVLFVAIPGLREWSVRMVVRWLPGRVGPRVEEMALAFFSGLGILRQRSDLARVGGLSVLAWLCEASMYLLIAQGFDLNISPLAVLMVTAAANLATLVPSSPGYVGPFEWGVSLVLVGALGKTEELALSYAIAVHAALYFPVVLLGLFFWWRQSFSWREMRRAA